MNEIIEAIRTLLKTELWVYYKKFYYGEIRVPNQAYLPFIEVIPVGSKVTNRGTGGMVNNEYSIQINVKNTLKKYLKENTNVETLDHIQDLVQKMEGRDTDTGDLLSTTVLWVLHDNLTLTISGNRKADINGDWDIGYDEIDLGESYITIATISFTVKVINY